MTPSTFFKGTWPIRRITMFAISLVTGGIVLSLFGIASSFEVDFKIPPKGYKVACPILKDKCEGNCGDLNLGPEELSKCQNCCKRDWYLCLEKRGNAGGPNDFLQPDDLAEYKAICGETFDSKIQEKAIEGILQSR